MNKINFKPVNEVLLVVAPVVNEKTEAGIIKSDAQIKEEKSKVDKFLEVAAVSDKITDIQVGDRVLIVGGEHKGMEIDGVTYLILNRISVIGKRLNPIEVYTESRTDSNFKPSAQ